MTKPCRACNAPMIWARTVNGMAIPMDADPIPGGNFVLIDRDPDPPLARFVPPAARAKLLLERPETPLYRSHFGTCSAAKTFRRGRKPHGRVTP